MVTELHQSRAQDQSCLQPPRQSRRRIQTCTPLLASALSHEGPQARALLHCNQSEWMTYALSRLQANDAD